MYSTAIMEFGERRRTHKALVCGSVGWHCATLEDYITGREYVVCRRDKISHLTSLFFSPSREEGNSYTEVL